MSISRCIVRFALAVALMILALFIFLYAIVFLIDVGPLGPARPGYMQTTSISIGPLTLFGGQLHAPSCALWSVATGLAAASAWLVGNTLFRLTKRSSERSPA